MSKEKNRNIQLNTPQQIEQEDAQLQYILHQQEQTQTQEQTQSQIQKQSQSAKTDQSVLDVFLKTVYPYLELDAQGKPAISYTKSEVIVKIKKTVPHQSDEFQKCVRRFAEIGGQWLGYANCAFSIKQKLAGVGEVLREVPVADLVYGPQPRLYRSEESKQRNINIAKDRIAQGFGPFINRLLTRPSRQFPGKHEVIDGYGRWEVALVLELSTVPIIEREISDLEAWTAAYLSNDAREDFCDFERGKYYLEMLQRFGLTYMQLAERLNVRFQRIGELVLNYKRVREEKKNYPDIFSCRHEKMPESITKPVLSAPEDVKRVLYPEVVNGDYSQKAVRWLVGEVKRRVSEGVESEAALVEAKKSLAAQKVAKIAPKVDASFVDDVKLDNEETVDVNKFAGNNSAVGGDSKVGGVDVAAKENVDSGSDALKGLSREDAEAALQADMQEKVKIEEAKQTAILRRLKNSYPEVIVDKAVKTQGIIGESKLSEILRDGYLRLWIQKLTIEEKDQFFSKTNL